ncbi:MAG: RelA/SpoT family protein [Chitinivibrionales bacterium]|nr:RelA/SpoT family protein [Chitinivibrionales bacterium]
MTDRPLAADPNYVAPRAAIHDGTVVLPSSTVDASCKAFLERIQDVNGTVSRELIEKAFRFSWVAHKDQRRKSGEPFLAHPVAVAMILAEQRLDSVTIAAGLLHDVLEDTSVSREELEKQFGTQITLLVDGVTKIQTLNLKSVRERQAETYRKMLLSMAEDVRVIIIKFADRLHNLRTLRYLPKERIEAVARETLDIYAPLAHRLGMARMRWDLEDLAFKHLYAKEYKEIVSKVVSTAPEREALIESFAEPLRWRLKQEHIEAAIVGRPKHFYSIYRKLVEQNRPFEEVYDLMAIRVIVDTVKDCYCTLGIVHELWTPIPDRFKDFISTPKSNGYRSLHTTVFGQGGSIVEIQIRTWEMHQVAEDGIAAHWLYKDGMPGGPSEDDEALVWLKNLIDWQKDLTDSSEFYEFFRIDLFEAEVFVFTPKGDLISLPKGATVLDFAFAVHTDLGLHCIGGRVDGKFEPTGYKLHSGSTVEVLHLNTKKPSVDWLREVRTPRARSAIRRWLKNASRREGIELGRNVVESNYKRLHLSSPITDHIPALLQHFGVVNLDQLYFLVGKGDIPVQKVMSFFQERIRRKSAPSRMVSRLVDSLSGKRSGVLVGGSDAIMVRFAPCCNPIPGDPILGFVTRGRGIVVHRTDCENAALFQNSDRTIEVNWDSRVSNTYIVFLDIRAQERPGLLHDIAGVFLNFGANILEGHISTVDIHVQNTFKIQIQNRNQLRQIVDRLRKIRGIERIERSRDASVVSGSEESEGT